VTVTTDEGGAPAGPPEPSPEPPGPAIDPRPAGPARRWLIVACGFLLVVEVVLGVRLVQARNENADLRQQLDDQVAALDASLTQLDDTRQRLAALQADTSGRTTDIEQTGRDATTRQVEIAELTSQLTRVSGQVRDLQTAVQQNHTIDQTKVQQLLLLNKCLDGIKQADLAATQGRTSDIVVALKGVSDVCQQTLQIMSPGDDANFPFDFADPSVIASVDGKTYYAYATNAGVGNVQIISSKDLKKWEFVGGTLTSLPRWAKAGNTWAPSVLRRDNVYYMYYAAQYAGTDKHCISVATASSPAGPFVDNAAAPMMCDFDKGGVIDPSAFVASDGTVYLLWKSEGEWHGGSARLWIRKLGDDFKSFDGDPSVLLGVDRPWEGITVEGPSMLEANGKFFLFYSGNRFDTADYAEGWAVCDAPIGPCTKPASNILLQKHDNIAGPGGAEIFVAPGGQPFIAFHAWTAPYIGYGNKRQLHVDKLNVVGGTPQVSEIS
jgi:GH43 family beta-xylosidase